VKKVVGPRTPISRPTMQTPPQSSERLYRCLKDRLPDNIWYSFMYQHFTTWEIYTLIEAPEATTSEEFEFPDVTEADFTFEYDD